MSPDSHAFKFARIGGMDQVILGTASDLSHLAELDSKLWAPLAMPTRGVGMDPKTLDFLDTDQDGRIRVPEVLAAVTRAVSVFKNPDDLFRGVDTVALAAIKDEGIRAGAQAVLQGLGKAQATSVSLADTTKIFGGVGLNGDGVITADSTTSADLRQALEDLSATEGTVVYRSGKPGVDKAKVEAFFKEARAWLDWHGHAHDKPAPLRLVGRAGQSAPRQARALPRPAPGRGGQPRLGGQADPLRRAGGGAALTRVAALPRNATLVLEDPYAEKRRPRKLFLLLVVVLALGGTWAGGKLDGWLPLAAKSVTVLGNQAPAAAPAVDAPAKPAVP